MPKLSASKPRTRLTKKQLELRRRRAAQKKRRKTEQAWKANVPQGYDPNAPKVGSPAFKKMQQQWYKKLKAEDPEYQDIEWQQDPDSPHLKQPASRGRYWTPGKQLYFALARNFLTHWRFRTRIERRAWELHTEGLSYRKIRTMLRAEFDLRKSLYWVFYYVQETAKKCISFNQTHAEGLLNPKYADPRPVIEQVIGAPEAEYGMQIDAGFWEPIRRRY